MTSHTPFGGFLSLALALLLLVVACGGNDTAGVVRNDTAGDAASAGSSGDESEGGSQSQAGRAETGGDAGATETGGHGGTVGGNGTGGYGGGSGQGGTASGGASTRGGASSGGAQSGGASDGGASGAGASDGGGTSGGRSSGGGSTGGTSPNGGTLSGAAGGLVSTGGVAGGASGPLDEICTEGTVTFVLQNFGAVSYCIDSCNGGVQIRPAEAQSYYVGAFGLPNCYAGNECQTCEPINCTDVECLAEPLPEQRQWDGRFYGDSTCDGSAGAGIACRHGRCAAPGDYVANLCVSPCGITAEPTCMEVPFEYPANSVVVVDPTFPDLHCRREPSSDSSCLDSARPAAYFCERSLRMPDENDCVVVTAGDNFDVGCCAM